MRRLFVASLFLVFACVIFFIAPNYGVTTFYAKDEIRILIDDKEITKDIPDPVVMLEDEVMLSLDTVDIYFDKWLYYDEKYDTYITTSDEHVAKFKANSNTITIDGIDKEAKVMPTVIGDIIYIPISELKEVYDIDIINNEKIIITNKNPEMQTITITEKNINLRALKNFWSRKTATIKKGEKLDVFRYSEDKEWIWARSEDGKLGYVSAKDVESYMLENYSENNLKETEKINLIWEYAENYTPNRQGEANLEEIDVLSPTWIYLSDEDGNLKNTIDESYIAWAHDEGYKIWAVLKNDRMGIEKTSQLVTDMKARENLISQLLTLCDEYKLDGINIDFEEMKKEDAKAFSEFVREISATLRRNGYKVSVDVTVPDGSDTWSLCYNRYELSEAVDYIILMAYDQYGSSSKKAGSVASYAWVENNVKKMVERDGIDSRKLVLGIPLYSRKWQVKNGKVVSSSVVTMKYLDKYINSENTTWLDEDKQYYYEYVNGSNYTVMWMDEKESIIQKLLLIEEYDLGGSAYWMLGYENDSFWKDISEFINY